MWRGCLAPSIFLSWLNRWLVVGNTQVLITIGAVIRGDTPHCDVVVAEASNGIAAVARDTEIPLIFGVMTTDTMQQALERAGIKSNLGWS